MKLMILGSVSGKDEEGFEILCRDIASTLVELDATLIICSLFEDSADYYVFIYFLKKSEKVELYYFESVEVREQITKVIKDSISIQLIPCLDENSKLDIRNAYLFCQINAIKQVDGIIAIGGKVDGSANLLLHLAELNKKLIIPLPQYEGAAENYYNRNKYKIKDLLGSKYNVLFTKDSNKIINSFLEVREKQNINNNNINHVFLSYARDNPKWADYIEVILRRRNISLFRDESEFKAGSDIPVMIQEEIFKADTFIAVWCKEYACSPWCIDEMELALERKGSINIWIICVDETRIVPKGARNLLNYTVKSREELEGTLLKLLMSTEQ